MIYYVRMYECRCVDIANSKCIHSRIHITFRIHMLLKGVFTQMHIWASSPFKSTIFANPYHSAFSCGCSRCIQANGFMLLFIFICWLRVCSHKCVSICWLRVYPHKCIYANASIEYACGRQNHQQQSAVSWHALNFCDSCYGNSLMSFCPSFVVCICCLHFFLIYRCFMIQEFCVYGVATTSRLLKIIGLFCKRAL